MDTENFALALIQVIGLATHSMNYDGTPREYNDESILTMVTTSIYGHVAMHLPAACSYTKIRKAFENEHWYSINCFDGPQYRRDLKGRIVALVQSMIDDHAELALLK